MKTVIRHAAVLDTSSMSLRESRGVVIDNGVIVDIDDASPGSADVDIDAKGNFVVPGMIDAHVHFRLATFDFRSLVNWSEVEFGIGMAALARQTVERGFTTVRDLGGDVTGLIAAIRRGAIVGPRIVRAGLMLTQTGGHGDAQGGARPVPQCGCAMHGDAFGIVADGADAVRKGARHLLRDGSDFLKIHVSGGVASPSDPLESTQYTLAEVEAAVTEARHRNTYVASHAYTPEAIAMAVRGGVFCIEHANLIDAETARLIASAGSVMVPTLVTYKAMADLGPSLGLPEANLAKNRVILESGLKSVDIASSAGVTLGLGTDLIGESQPMQNRELELRAEVQSPAEVLNSLWNVNARLCKLEGKIGVVAPGAIGDVLVSTVNPLDDIAAFADHTRSLTHVIQGGVPVVSRNA